jgi:hypothetical protein
VIAGAVVRLQTLRAVLPDRHQAICHAFTALKLDALYSLADCFGHSDRQALACQSGQFFGKSTRFFIVYAQSHLKFPAVNRTIAYTVCARNPLANEYCYVRKARKLAARDGTTLRALVEQGLHLIITEKRRSRLFQCARRPSKVADFSLRWAARGGRQFVIWHTNETAVDYLYPLGYK